MPHGVFTAFSIAGIVFYRQVRAHDDILAKLGRAALDSYQMVINEAHDHWDAGPWTMRIFDFLLSSLTKKDTIDSSEAQAAATPFPALGSQLGLNISGDTMTTDQEVLHSINWESPKFYNSHELSTMVYSSLISQIVMGGYGLRHSP
ncbi:hypothetical protein H2198_001025 [Neophaeococcomyces mojaviensis]|uniref:Uncharacterized protein n=1 Tax=Neophaeococcomyces mojaviensis TaxID=3383035 RepID=A0ACC3AI49_9EURO|nr:hypothetical protein H2198_001025 [Knufia sp. JES_112]